MGYILNAQQVKALRTLIDDDEVTDIELLWLPWHVEVRLWQRKGQCVTKRVDHDGQLMED